MRLLACPRKTEQDEVLLRKNGVDDLRDDGIFKADDAREKRLLSLQAGDQVASASHL